MLGLSFLNPTWAARAEENERLAFERMAKTPTEWDALTTKWAERLVLNGATYKPECLIPEAPVVPAKAYLKSAKRGVHSPSGRFVFIQIANPRGTPLALYQPAERVGQVRFTTDVNIPTLLEWYKGGHDAKTWMSLTPSEMMTQRNGIRRASGEVVVYGLGMGWFLAQVCAKKSVTRVTVVEREREILDWLRPRVEALYPQVKEKVAEWVCMDAYKYVDDHTDAEDTRAHLFDIWPGWKDAPWDTKFQRLKAYLPRIWGWGDHYVRETSRW
jgi:hypothetical protein